MFRDKPTAYDRLTDAISDIGDRIVELESQIADRVNPKPSTFERLKREVSRLPGLPHQRGRWDFLSNLHLPSADDARDHLDRAQRSLRSGAHEVGDHVREGAGTLRSYLPAITPALGSLRLPGASDIKALRRRHRPQGLLDHVRNNPGLSTAVVVGGVVLAAGAALYASNKIAEHAEEPDYDVVRKEGDIEIRDYEAMLVAETVKGGYHEKARRLGFEALYNFIRAHNRSGKKIAMTTPVLQQLSEGDGKAKGWAIRFIMPSKYSKSSLPAPETDDVRIEEVPARRMVAIRFGGVFNASLASKKLMALYNYLADENLKQKGDPVYAFYNPPWTPGFLRRNEILIEVES
ncbi:heme-binding protein [Aureimonas altamirensis]|uniref:SOUL family heme-binding protein n=1 Tax=Aureimonas altamirensis TaxID=370622 RepID=UPI0020371109|nr:heme-binding protein [Aureimonas altamirensis]MCM2505320.1 heme-binding protein [Aureimonas altamirensis]